MSAPVSAATQLGFLSMSQHPKHAMLTRLQMQKSSCIPSKSTSPTSLGLAVTGSCTLLIPTSMTAAPSLIMSAVIKLGIPERQDTEAPILMGEGQSKASFLPSITYPCMVSPTNMKGKNSQVKVLLGPPNPLFSTTASLVSFWTQVCDVPLILRINTVANCQAVRVSPYEKHARVLLGEVVILSVFQKRAMPCRSAPIQEGMFPSPVLPKEGSMLQWQGKPPGKRKIMQR